MTWDKLADWIKLRPRYLVPIFIAVSILLFGTEGLLGGLGLEEIVQSYRGWFGAAWLLTGSLLLSHAALAVAGPLIKRYRQWRRVRALQGQMDGLSGQELAVLARYIDEDTSTVILTMGGGRAESLEAKKIIFRSSSISAGWSDFAYTIQTWAREYLMKNPKVLEPGRLLTHGELPYED